MDQTTSLLNKSVKGYIPLTGGKNVRERKKILRSLLENAIGTNTDLEEARRVCRGKQLRLRVTFFLLGNSTEEGRRRKDLDNLLKLLLDVLSEYMAAKGSPSRELGLGLISDDDLVYEIHCSKIIVNDSAEEGINLEISEYDKSLESTSFQKSIKEL